LKTIMAPTILISPLVMPIGQSGAE
jgi:hypothetical protein